MTLREQMITEATATLKKSGLAVNINTLSGALPDDFALEADEVPVEGELRVAEPIDELGAPLVPEAAAADPAADPLAAIVLPTEAEIEAAADAVIQANETLAAARANVSACQWRERLAVEARSKAISQWQAGFAPYTPVQQAHDFARNAALERGQAGHMGSGGPVMDPPAASAIDRQRKWARGATVDDGRGNSGRGAYPASRRGEIIPKPPSVR